MPIWPWSRRYPLEDDFADALVMQNVEKVELILSKRGAPVDVWFSPSSKLHGSGQLAHVEYTGLLWAAHLNNVDLLLVLIKAGAKVNAQLQGRDVEFPYTALHIAAQNGFTNIAKALVSAGADVNLCVAKNGTSFGALLGGTSTSTAPLHIACINGYLAAVQALLEHPSIDVNKPAGVKGPRPIHCAIQSGNLQVLAALLSKKPDLELATCTPSSTCPLTALQFVLSQFSPLDNSDDDLSDSCTSLSDTPSFCRCSPRRYSSPSRLPCPSSTLSDMVELLLRNGADLHVCDSAGNTVLHQAVTLGCSRLVEVLLRHGAPSCAINHLGKSAWITALEGKNDRIIALLAQCRRSDVQRRHSLSVHSSRSSLTSETGSCGVATNVLRDDTSSGDSMCSDCPLPRYPNPRFSMDAVFGRATSSKVHTC